ncbi:MAG: 6,7-dimethyl-8-ribityllumazine synthase [Deltaproteobacteria bacterium]|nr:6,7-dimethyl-8-ribityllumazine synthase [Deltaproteobacteria bacterium]
MGTTYKGGRSAAGMRFAIAAGAFNEFIVEKLVSGAIELIVASGGDRDAIDVAWCPGAVEIPLVAKRLAESGRYDAILGIGAVIRGGTPHFDFVAAQASNGLAKVQLDSDLPVSFGVLTVDTIEQAIERAGTKMGNKGAEAAIAAIEMVDLLRKLPGAE